MATGILRQIVNYVIRLLTRKAANEIIKSAGGRTTRRSSTSSRSRSAGSRSTSRQTSGTRRSAGNRKSLTGDEGDDLE